MNYKDDFVSRPYRRYLDQIGDLAAYEAGATKMQGGESVKG